MPSSCKRQRTKRSASGQGGVQGGRSPNYSQCWEGRQLEELSNPAPAGGTAHHQVKRRCKGQRSVDGPTETVRPRCHHPKPGSGRRRHGLGRPHVSKGCPVGGSQLRLGINSRTQVPTAIVDRLHTKGPATCTSTWREPGKAQVDGHGSTGVDSHKAAQVDRHEYPTGARPSSRPHERIDTSLTQVDRHKSEWSGQHKEASTWTQTRVRVYTRGPGTGSTQVV